MNQCKNCAHWEHDEWGHTRLEVEYQEETTGGNWGECTAAGSSIRDANTHRAAYDGGYTGDFITREDFGCNQWEEAT